METLYIISDGAFVKVGVTAVNVESRLNQLQIGNPNKLFIVDTFQVDRKNNNEYKIHTYFKDKRMSGEWFDIVPDESFLEKVKEIVEEEHKIKTVSSTDFISRLLAKSLESSSFQLACIIYNNSKDGNFHISTDGLLSLLQLKSRRTLIRFKNELVEKDIIDIIKTATNRTAKNDEKFDGYRIKKSFLS